jgi:hypothetical protein
MVAARMVMPFLQEAETGRAPELLPGMKSWSIDQMAESVLADSGQSDPQNVESRVWRRSVPVIHLAAAVAVLGQDRERANAGPLKLGHLLADRPTIEHVVSTAQAYEALIPRISRFTINPERLIRLRPA